MAERCGQAKASDAHEWICIAPAHPEALGNHVFQVRVIPVCPECAAGKHVNCDGQALDLQLDEITECRCHRSFHQDRSPT